MKTLVFEGEKINFSDEMIKAFIQKKGSCNGISCDYCPFHTYTCIAHIISKEGGLENCYIRLKICKELMLQTELKQEEMEV